MSRKKMILATDEFYHIFNKTVGNENIFESQRSLNRVLSLINFYRFKPSISYSYFQNLSRKKKENYLSLLAAKTPLVEIYAFAFMPNHFHFLLKQLKNEGIEWFVSNLQNSFARYYNKKNEREGAVFCHSFQRVRIESEEQFIHVSRYIHLNPVTAYLIKIDELENYPYTSFPVYLKKKRLNFVEKTPILNHFKTIKRYKRFVYDQEGYQKKLKKIKNLLFE